MHNRNMERSSAYSGIVGAILFVISGVIPGQFPQTTASSTDISAYGLAHGTALSISAWLTLPAVAFILWFAVGLFDYLRDPDGKDRTLLQWGVASAIAWAALLLTSAALEAAFVIRNPGTSATLPTMYVYSFVLFAFGMGAFAAFAFSAANAGRRQRAMPQWLTLLGYLVFVVDVLWSLTIFSHAGTISVTGIGAIVAPVVSAIWIFLASVVLLVSVPRVT
jgi:hypothetical protein